MKSTLSKTVLALLVCTCIATDLSPIASRDSAVTFESKLDTEAGPVISASVAIPAAATQSTIQKKSLVITFPGVKAETQAQQPQQLEAPAAIEQSKIDSQPAQSPVDQVPFRIFDIFIRPEGAPVTESGNAGDAAFFKLIQTLSKQQLVQEQDFTKIGSLDLKARLALTDKLNAAFEKLQELTKSSKIAANGAQSPVSLIIQLLRRARLILELKIKLSAPQNQASAPKFTCPHRAKLAAQQAQAAAAAPAAQTSAPKFTCPYRAKLAAQQAQAAAAAPATQNSCPRFTCPHQAKPAVEQAQAAAAAPAAQTSAPKFTCPYRAKLAAQQAQAAAAAPAAQTSAPKFTCPYRAKLAAQQAQADTKPATTQAAVKVEPLVKLDVPVKDQPIISLSATVQPTLQVEPAVQIDIGSKVGRRLKKLSSLQL